MCDTNYSFYNYIIKNDFECLLHKNSIILQFSHKIILHISRCIVASSGVHLNSLKVDANLMKLQCRETGIGNSNILCENLKIVFL